MNIFVGNLSFEAKEADVYKLFMGFGSVACVTIVMEKKGNKSRGFGFLEMPDEQEAQAAIVALNDKEFMGRPLKVETARPKPQTSRDSESENQARPGFNPNFKRTGGYRQGRRTQSFLRKRAAAGIEGPVMPPKKYHENPMRWRKKGEQPKPWEKKREEPKPWEKKREEPKPWQKKQGESKPWQKRLGESKPWEKSGVESKPWKKSSNRKKSFPFKGRKKSER